MTRVAIIGTGISGLGCAHFLHSRFDCTLYEQNNYVGGHTNTIVIQENGSSVPIDTGFMVYNEVTYPNFTRLLKELKIKTKPTSMSFSVQHLPTGLEYCGSSLNHLFAQRSNLFNLRYIRMLMQINRFNKESIDLLSDPQSESTTLKQYADKKKYGKDFLNLYLLPMSSAVWSTPSDLMLEFPAVTLIRFFHNHGFLGLHTQHQWFTVQNGAQSYVTKLIAPFKNKIRVGQRVTTVNRESSKIKVMIQDGSSEWYDKVIFSSHANQTLKLLSNPTEPEQRLLSKFNYQTNTAILHTDSSVMPKTRRAWASWNHRTALNQDGSTHSSTHYWMNSLHSLSNQQNYFVSLNAEEQISPEKILREIEYEHPIFNLEAIQTQKELPNLNRQSLNQTTYFCGSYFKYGFHEDGLNSSLDLCRTLLKEPPWN